MAWILGQLVDLSEQDERRSASRKKLRLDLTLEGKPDGLVQVLDLSSTGMMIHSNCDFEPGESFLVQLSEGQTAVSQIMWKRESLMGCRFLPPLSRAGVAQILLKAAPQPHA
ncbi:PilZ domain-containing protein [Novosphingobium sp.]|uniref:PilZ domain-containing protein n=1 Tax=Novosphingobium sp. TaxID=1874826 RepID=UPI0035AEF6B1